MTDPYKEEVLGKRCKVYFLMEYDDNKSKMNKKKNDKEQLQAFAGQVTKYKVDWEQKQDTAKREHYVIFDDGDERWLELNQEALHGRVEWLEPVATNASRKRAKHAPPVALPEKQQKAARRSKMGSEKKEATDKEHSKRARMATSGKSVVQSNGKDAQQAMWTTPGTAVPTASSLQNDKGAKDDGDPFNHHQNRVERAKHNNKDVSVSMLLQEFHMFKYIKPNSEGKLVFAELAAPHWVLHKPKFKSTMELVDFVVTEEQRKDLMDESLPDVDRKQIEQDVDKACLQQMNEFEGKDRDQKGRTKPTYTALGARVTAYKTQKGITKLAMCHTPRGNSSIVAYFGNNSNNNNATNNDNNGSD